MYCAFQGVSQDITSYEHVIESVRAKAQELTLKSPSAKLATQNANIIQRYENLRDRTAVSVIVFKLVIFDLIVEKLLPKNLLKIWNYYYHYTSKYNFYSDRNYFY